MQKNDRSHIKAYALMSGILAQLVGSILVGIFGGQWVITRIRNRGIRNDSTHSTLLFGRAMMIDVHGLVQRQKKYMYYLLALLVLGWGFTSYKDVFLGLIIGTIFSFLSLRIIARRTDKLLDRVTNGENVKFKATAVSTYSRFATIGLLILFAAKYQELIAMWGLGVGLLTGYLVMIIDFLYLEYKSREER